MPFEITTFSSNFNEIKQFDINMLGEAMIIEWPNQPRFGKARLISNNSGVFQSDKLQIFHIFNIKDCTIASAAIRLPGKKTIIGAIEIIKDSSGIFYGRIFTNDELAEIGEDNSGASPEKRIAIKISKELNSIIMKNIYKIK